MKSILAIVLSAMFSMPSVYAIERLTVVAEDTVSIEVSAEQREEVGEFDVDIKANADFYDELDDVATEYAEETQAKWDKEAQARASSYGGYYYGGSSGGYSGGSNWGGSSGGSGGSSNGGDGTILGWVELPDPNTSRNYCNWCDTEFIGIGSCPGCGN